MSEETFNYGLVDKNSNILDDIPVKSFIQKLLVPTYCNYYRESDGFGTYDCKTEEGDKVIVSGIFLDSLVIGQTYSINGHVNKYKGQKQINVKEVSPEKPKKKDGIISYVQTLNGLEFYGDVLYDRFGDELLEILLTEPKRIVKEVNNIDESYIETWQNHFDKLTENKEIFNKLKEFGLNNKQAKLLYDEYKEGVVFKIEANPFFLIDKVSGFAFKKCDDLATKMGYPLDGMYRVQEAIRYVTDLASLEGHTYLPRKEVIDRVKKLLDIKLNITTIKKLLRSKDETISYEINGHSYDIKLSDLQNSHDKYYALKTKADKDDARYAVINISEDEIIKEMENLSNINKLVVGKNAIFLPKYYLAEKKIADKVKALATEEELIFEDNLVYVEDYLRENNYNLEEKQLEAVVRFSKGTGGFFVLNGSAGCGKTFTLNIILTVLEKMYSLKNMFNPKIQVFAPTGKASKVAQKATKRSVITVHKGLKYNPELNSFEHNELNLLSAEVIVVDESSMLDAELAMSLLVAIRKGTKVILLGDTKQLPSVGAGNVLKDLIESNVVEVVTLNVVKRQGKDSGIIKNAQHIINKEMIETAEENDAYVFSEKNPEEILKTLLKSIRQVKTGLKCGIEDIQVLSPQRTTMLGTDALNYYVQQFVNPTMEDDLLVPNKNVTIINLKTGKTITRKLCFKVGDKVIHTRNDYSKKWYEKGQYWDYQELLGMDGISNGETGVIIDIKKEIVEFDKEQTKIIVQYDGNFVFYEDDFDDLEHAYALTIHKSQGSQWQAVILPISSLTKNMLDNNLLYTGYTRSQKINIVIGDKESILYSIKSQRLIQRHTALKAFLMSKK